MAVSLACRGLRVSDPAASAHFYEGLGFRRVEAGGDPVVDPERGAPDGVLLRNGHGVTLHLVRLPAPGRRDLRRRRPMTALGLTHLNFYVRDFAATLDAVRARGGAVAEETLISVASGGGRTSMIYCVDPDGIRVEIWSTEPYGVGGFSSAIPGIDHKFSHSGICVRDLRESISFYEALGFVPAETFDYRDPPGQLDRMFEEVDSRAVAQMMRNGNDVIELLAFLHPQPRRDRGWDGSADPGFCRLVFNAASLNDIPGSAIGPGVAEAARRHVCSRSPTLIRGADPNGVTIEFIVDGRDAGG